MNQLLGILGAIAFLSLWGCASEPIGPIQYDKNGHSCQQVQRYTPGWGETEITECSYQPLPFSNRREWR